MRPPAWILQLLLFPLLRSPDALCAPRISPYTLYNYTWLIINEAGDVANSTSTLATSPPWTPLHVDLCALAMGASAAWGLPSSFMPKDRPPSTYTPPPISEPRPQYGCQSPAHRDKVNSQPIYVCPGSHRPRARDYTCGSRSDYFCASWGCETSGTVSWTVSSQRDYIRVSAPNYNEHARLSPVQPSAPACSCSRNPSAWCNPLVFTFTTEAHSADWTRAHEWGLRLYMQGQDQGLTFSLRLLKELPHSSSPFALGPNLAQAPRPLPVPPPTPPPPPLTSFSLPTQPTADISSTPAPSQLTLPPGAPSDTARLLDLMNASAMAIPDPAYKECWICFSPAPPFYEGVAVHGTPILYTDPNLLPWGVHNEHAITVGQIIGSGLCLHPNGTRMPHEMSSTCNDSMLIYPSPTPSLDQPRFLLAPNGTYFACASGLTPHIIIDDFYLSNDYCVLILLLPRLSVHHTEDLLAARMTGPGYARHKREPVTAITIGLLLAVGATGAGTGIASLVETQGQLRHLEVLRTKVDEDIAELKQGLKHLTNTVNSLAEMVLQNRRGLNLAFLKEGGVCAALKEECCVFKDETGLVRDSIKRVEKSLEERRREIDQSES